MSIHHSFRLSGMLLLLAMLSGLLGCGSEADVASESSGPRKLTVQLNWFPEPEFGGLYAALENGHFERHGLEVELIKGGVHRALFVGGTALASAWSLTLFGAKWQAPQWQAPRVKQPVLVAPKPKTPVFVKPQWRFKTDS